MLQLTERLEQKGEEPVLGQLSLPYELRIKSRLRTQLLDGTEVGLLLPRGTVLRGGDTLRSEAGDVVEVVAASETVSVARAGDAQLLARAAYHLGNRHMSLQIGEDWISYLHDHVLDDMVRQLGLEVTCEQRPFEPEGGAYGGHGFHGGHEHHHH
ncbi:MAG: urease accessory protein UreE [Gammaproteobacteria bacterium]|nr:urease accessory protein UreE [Gammaproteobacteria bacterium]